MESRAKLAGHAIHPMLITLPLGLLGTAVVFDIIRAFTDDADFAVASFYLLAAGIIGGLLAALFGLIDWLAIPAGTRAKRVGLWHGAGNVVVVVLFAVSWLLRRGQADYQPTGVAFWLGWSRCCWRWRPPGPVGSWWNGWGSGWMRAPTWTRPAPCPAQPAPAGRTQPPSSGDSKQQRRASPQAVLLNLKG